MKIIVMVLRRVKGKLRNGALVNHLKVMEFAKCYDSDSEQRTKNASQLQWPDS